MINNTVLFLLDTHYLSKRLQDSTAESKNGPEKNEIWDDDVFPYYP